MRITRKTFSFFFSSTFHLPVIHLNLWTTYTQMTIIMCMEKIFKFVEKETGVHRDAFKNKGRNKEGLFPRGLYVSIARRLRFSFPAIGKMLDGRDHTTIIHTLEKYKENEEINALVAKYINECGEGTKPEGVSVKMLGRYAWIHEKFEGRCFICSFDEIVEVHHILPRRLGGDDGPDNLVLLCPNHHALADRGMLAIKDINSPKVSRTYSTYPHP